MLFFKRLFKRRPYRVRFEGRDLIRYTEGDRTMVIESDIGSKHMLIYKESIDSWLPPHEADEVTEQDHERICRNLEESLGKVEFIEPSDW